MKFNLLVFFVLFTIIIPSTVRARQTENKKSIKAMLVTGGCCHDYEKQKKIITEGIQGRCKIKIDWTIVHQGGTTTDTKIPLYENKDWAKGYDIVIHNECFAGIGDKEWIERVLKPHREGVNAIVIHCAMHTFRNSKDNDYRDFLGVTSRSHGPHHAFQVENLESNDPIMKGFGQTWDTPTGELYYVDNIGSKATPLARAFNSGGRKKQEVCIWKNEYGKCRVFGTTIGHHNETMSTPKYLNFLTRGFLWAVDKLDEKNLKAPPVKKVRVNLALNKPAICSANQNSHLPRAATDGSLATRYCADSNEAGDWFQVDLQSAQQLTGVEVHWEQSRLYRFKLEGSADGKSWKMLHDGTKNNSREQTQTYNFQADNIRYLKMTSTETESGAWYSFWEFRVLGTKVIEVDESTLNNRPLTDPNQLLSQVKVPEGFDAKIFAAPPQVNYPVCLTSTQEGVIYVGIDKNGSLDRKTGRGSVVRCIDTDGDLVADEFSKFCEVDSPRGLIWDRDRLYVLHPPDLSVFFDDDQDGKADRQETLVKGVGFDLNFRGADHTTNGIRMGIDGWIYIAVGDYGFIEATGADGTTLPFKGGGVVRVKPDGSNLEIYARGLRNICDIAIDPYMNLFTRDNTNDGGGWDIRLSHIMQTANYGYPSLYKNFNDEIMPPLADYGGGSGTGALYASEGKLPAKYRNALFSCDWGLSKVFFHPLKTDGATYTAQQETFLSIPRPTDMDIDSGGNIYVASWRGGQFKYAGENIGYVLVLQPKGESAKNGRPDLKKMSYDQLADLLTSNSDSLRLAAVREFVGRGKQPGYRGPLLKALGQQQTAQTRIAALSAWKEIEGLQLDSKLLNSLLKGDPRVQAFTVRSLGEQWNAKGQIAAGDVAQLLKTGSKLSQREALIALGRIGDPSQAAAILQYASQITIDRSSDNNVKTPVNTSNKTLRHLAIHALAAIGNTKAIIAAAAGPSSISDVALETIKLMHHPESVDALIGFLQSNPSNIKAWESLIRLYHAEGPYKGKWWGTRPDTKGPYYDRMKWSESDRIEQFLKTELVSMNEKTRASVVQQLTRHQIKLAGMDALVKKMAAKNGATKNSATVNIPDFDKNNPQQLGNIPYQTALQKTTQIKGDLVDGAKIFQQQSCGACHTVKKGAEAVGPQLLDIGKRYKRHELVESILQPNAKIAQGFATQMISTVDGLLLTGFVTREAGNEVEIRTAQGKSIVIQKADIEARKESKQSVMPAGLVNNLTAKQLASLLAYLESLQTNPSGN
jgi:putative heme-binding domain-containing protein